MDSQDLNWSGSNKWRTKLTSLYRHIEEHVDGDNPNDASVPLHARLASLLSSEAPYSFLCSGARPICPEGNAGS